MNTGIPALISVSGFFFLQLTLFLCSPHAFPTLPPQPDELMESLLFFIIITTEKSIE